MTTKKSTNQPITMATEKPEDTSPRPLPNVVLTARDAGGKLNTSRAVGRINTATGRIKLPPPSEQGAPFFHADAERIIAAMPHLYKPHVDKGKH